MDFKSLFVQFLSGSDSLQAATGRSLWLFLPELILCGSIVLMLLARLTSGDKLIPTHWFALLGSLSAFVMVMFQFWQLGINNEPYTVLFTGLAVHDMFSVFFRGFLLFFLVFVIALTVGFLTLLVATTSMVIKYELLKDFTALAQMSDGSWWTGAADVIVTIAACLEDL